MTNRERWIVYPLLFLALGLALRSGMILSDRAQDKIFSAGIVQCKALQVVDANNKPRVIVEADGKDGAGVLEILSGNGRQLVVVSAANSGSVLKLVDERKKTAMILGNTTGPLLFEGKIESDGNIKPLRGVPFIPLPTSLLFHGQTPNQGDSEQHSPDEPKASTNDSTDPETPTARQ